MTTLIMLFLFPIGLYTYFVIEKRTKKEYQAIFDNFQSETSDNANYTDTQKIERFEQMLLQNDYEIKELTQTSVVGEKKVLSLAFIFMGLGLYIVGLFFYLAYFFWFQKPHRVEFKV